MAATDAADLSRLPGAVLKEDHRETVITFGGAIEVRGIVEKGEGGNVSVGAGDRIVITGIDVLERKSS
jgi:hypothetical protein